MEISSAEPQDFYKRPEKLGRQADFVIDAP
jgi:hypothetical protein